MKKAVFYWLALSVLAIFVLTGLYFFKASALFAESEKILAKIEGKVFITQRDLDEVLKRYEPTRKGNPYSLEEKKNFLNMLIENTLISMEAEKERLNEKPEIQSKLKLYKNDLLVREYIVTKIEPFITVKKEEVDEIMKKNPQLIPGGEKLTIKEIVVKTEKEAEEIYQELKKGADFSKMVSEKSIAPSKAKEGLLGDVSRGQLLPDFETVVFNLKEGEFSKPIKSDEGFRILYLANKKEVDPEQIKILEGKVRDKIIQLEKNKKIGAMIEKKVEELRKQIKVETYSDQIK